MKLTLKNLSMAIMMSTIVMGSKSADLSGAFPNG